MSTMQRETVRQTASDPQKGRQFPHLHEYLGYWAFHEGMFQKLQQQVRPHVSTHLSLYADKEEAEIKASNDVCSYDVTSDGVAIIEMRGPMMKFESSFGGASTVATRRMIRNAVSDRFVKSIVLVIDSPGGTVSGTKELADDVAWATTQKPLYTFIEDFSCSAAYWVASQATKVFSNATALVGCIGTYMVVYDQSEQYAEEGVVAHVIRAGDFKGAGVPGTKITPEQLADWQGEVNDLNAFFVAGVASGRGVALSTAEKWADGRAHVASKAQKMGLIDGITTMDAAIEMAVRARKPKPQVSTSRVVLADDGEMPDPEDCPMGDQCPMSAGDNLDGSAEAKKPCSMGDQCPMKNSASGGKACRDGVTVSSILENLELLGTTVVVPNSQITGGEPTQHPQPGAPGDSPPKEENTMSTEVKSNPVSAAPLPATLAEIKSGCPGADSDFIIGQLQASASLADAQSAWMSEQNKRFAMATIENDRLKLNAANGNVPLSHKGEGQSAANFEGDPIDAFHALFAKHLAAGKPRAKINHLIALENPELHQSFIDACNAEAKSGKSTRRLVP